MGATKKIKSDFSTQGLYLESSSIQNSDLKIPIIQVGS